eukprot:SAG31_NODE_366_length_16817_cov_17.317921_7_plen_150_part_00
MWHTQETSITEYEDRTFDFNSWQQFGSGAKSLTRSFVAQVTASPRQHVFIFGEGPDDEPLREEVTMLQVSQQLYPFASRHTNNHLFYRSCDEKSQVTANRPVVVEAVAPISTVHTVPIYLYKGSRDDMTGFLFDMEVDETIRVSVRTLS